MDILDYIKWRGDISFDQCALNEVDILIFTQLAYLDFNLLISEDYDKKISLKELSDMFFFSINSNKTLGILINPKIKDLLLECAKSKRFSNVLVSAYISKFSKEQEYQFASLTFTIKKPKITIVTFRGTDDTLIGWKEDFNMLYKDSVPSQIFAKEYFEYISKETYNDIILCGHSKGGNLAIYASLFCSDKCKKDIAGVYNYDGPGFNEDVLQNALLIKNKPCIKTFLPQDSIIGLLLEQYSDLITIKSNEKNGLMQHDAFSWNVNPTTFEILDSTNKRSIVIDHTITKFLKNVSKDKRKDFVNALFEIFDISGALTLTEAVKITKENPIHIIKNYSNIDHETKNIIFKMFGLLYKTARVTIPTTLISLKNNNE